MRESTRSTGKGPRRFLSILLVFLAAFIAACSTEPVTGRKQLNFIPEGQANELGLQAYQQMLAESKVSNDSNANRMVEQVGRRIAEPTDRRMKEDDREPFQWEFKVIDDPKMINAFCLPGGKVAFYTGILPICGNENGVAVVMGHEIAHAYAKHGASRMSTAVLGQASLAAASAALSAGIENSELAQVTAAALGVGFTLGVALPFSRSDESAADEIGLTLMAEAGYDPREAVAFWQRMQKASGGKGPPEFLSTHPDHENRIGRLQDLMPKAVAIYEKSKPGGK